MECINIPASIIVYIVISYYIHKYYGPRNLKHKGLIKVNKRQVSKLNIYKAILLLNFQLSCKYLHRGYLNIPASYFRHWAILLLLK
jgi:hypothetical protein